MVTTGGSAIASVGIAARLDRPDALRCASSIVGMFREMGLKVEIEYFLYKRLKMLLRENLGDSVKPVLVTGLAKNDLVVVVGGDGTLLRLLHYLESDVKVVGVRVGRRGFLMNFECKTRDLEDIASGRYRFKRIHRLIVDGVHAPPAVNEVVVSAARGKTVALELKVYCSKEHANLEFRGDGIIISTPIGSYAYNLSAKGPLLYCDNCVVLTPLNPMPADVYPIVLNSSCKIEVSVVEGYRAPWLIIDGQYAITIPLGSRFVVETGYDVLVASKKG